jgi:D-arabinose 1-dehydrogenase-like Zn-dependent alcohol dehydrogenase
MLIISSASGATDEPPVKLDTAIIFAPAGELVPVALRALDKGGTLVLGGIHMSAIPFFRVCAFVRQADVALSRQRHARRWS